MKEHELRKRIKREKIQEQMPESTRKRMDDLLDDCQKKQKEVKFIESGKMQWYLWLYYPYQQ